MKSGNQYQTKDAANANMKNLYREAVHFVLWEGVRESAGFMSERGLG